MSRYSQITWYNTPLFHLLKDPSGDVGRYLYKRGLSIQSAARAKVGKRTGALAASIGISMETTLAGQQMLVGSRLDYAYMRHQGTRPHIITANKPGGHLRFSNTGRVVYARSVMHPGTRPNKYLSSFLYMVR